MAAWFKPPPGSERRAWRSQTFRWGGRESNDRSRLAVASSARSAIARLPDVAPVGEQYFALCRDPISALRHLCDTSHFESPSMGQVFKNPYARRFDGPV